MIRPLLFAALAALIIATAHAQFDDHGGLELEERIPLTEDDARRDLSAAMQTSDPGERSRLFLALHDALQANPDVILPPREWQQFCRSLIANADHTALRARVPGLLADTAGADIDPTITRRVNLGLQIASAVGGAAPATLRGILEKLPDADRTWLLPALAQAAGPSALADIAPYRADDTIKPLAQPQNLQPIPCAALLAAAYAGDERARLQVLQWYEDDSRDLPRFAWYVEWAKREGMTPDYRILDYCQQRLTQGTYFLDSIPNVDIAPLVTRAVDQASPALTDYLLARLHTVPPSELTHFLGLLSSPLVEVKSAIVTRTVAAGHAPTIAAVTAILESQLTSPHAAERYAAMTILMQLSPATQRNRITRQIATDPSPELRKRLVDELQPKH